MSAWSPERAAELAEMVYRYVADVYAKGTSYRPLDVHTEAAHEAERVGDMQAFEDALRELMRATRAEAMRAKAGAA